MTMKYKLLNDMHFRKASFAFIHGKIRDTYIIICKKRLSRSVFLFIMCLSITCTINRIQVHH